MNSFLKNQVLAAFDLDGTLLKKNSSFAFCRFLCEARFISPLDFLFCLAVYIRHCYFGLSLLRLHHLIFKRIFFRNTIDTLQPFLEKFLDAKLANLWYQPALLRLKLYQKQGIECVILSNSPFFLVQRIAQKIGIEKVFATEYQSNEKGELIGIASLMDGIQKETILRKISSKIIAFSDSHLDLPFLESAHCAVAVNPKQALKKIAKKRGWEIL